MEPKNDPELSALLREWKSPEVPASLEARVLAGRRSWWSVWLRGYIRVPVPVACCLALLMIAEGWWLAKEPGPCSTATIVRPAHALVSIAKSKICWIDSSC